MTEVMQTPDTPQEVAAVKAPVSAPAAVPTETVEPEKEPLLPDGIGLSIENVRDLLVKKHDCKVSLDDPVLMVVTMLNAYLGEVRALQKKHEAGLSRLMADKTDDYMKGVKEAVKALQDGLSSASVEGIKAVFNEHDSRLKAFKSNLSWLAAITACSALVNVIAFVLMGMR